MLELLNKLMEEHSFRNEDIIMHLTAAGMVEKKEDLPAGIRIESLREPVPHLCHQEPFNCCTQTAASSDHGSTIAPRPIPAYLIPQLTFGAVKFRQKPLKTNEKRELTTLSVSGCVRKMSDETQKIFEALFE